MALEPRFATTAQIQDWRQRVEALGDEMREAGFGGFSNQYTAKDGDVDLLMGGWHLSHLRMRLTASLKNQLLRDMDAGVNSRK